MTALDATIARLVAAVALARLVALPAPRCDWCGGWHRTKRCADRRRRARR